MKGVLSCCFYICAKNLVFATYFLACFLGGRSMAFLSLMKAGMAKSDAVAADDGEERQVNLVRL